MKFQKKGFTLIELLSVIVILAVIALIAIPIIGHVINEAKKGALRVSAHNIAKVIEEYAFLEEKENIFTIENGKLSSDDLPIQIKKSILSGIIFIFSRGEYVLTISDDKYCATKTTDSDVEITEGKCNQDNTDMYIVHSAKQVSTADRYSTIIYNQNTDSDVSVKYLVSRLKDEIGVDHEKWNGADNLEGSYVKLDYQNDSIIPGIFYVHTLVEDGESKREQVSQGVHVVIDEQVRISRLTRLYDSMLTEQPTPIIQSNVIEIDYVQPWAYVEDNLLLLTRKFKALKRAGYQDIIIQYSSTLVEDDNGNVKLGEVFYTTNLDEHTNDKTIVYDETLDKIMIAAQSVGLGIYIGSPVSSIWWDTDKIKTNAYYNQMTEITNDVQREVYEKYQSYGIIKGFYWADEMYTSNDGIESYWVNYLNNYIEHIETLNPNLPLIVSPFFSSITGADMQDVENQWDYIVSHTNFRANDIINFQDGLGNAEYSVEEIEAFISVVRSTIKTNKPNVKFYLNIENFADQKLAGGTKSANIQRMEKQIEISKYYADGLTSFSYLHYYNPYQQSVRGTGVIASSYDTSYRQLLGYDTSDTSIVIASDIPAGGYVYVDSNEDEAPIPPGFTISSIVGERTIKEGLVIKDSFQNEFVFIPTYLGIKKLGHQYRVNEGNNAGYSRFLRNNVSDIESLLNDQLPAGVLDEQNQIKKYFGFYIGRYEASYNFNGGKRSVASTSVLDQNADTQFWPVFADSAGYNGKLMLNMKYTEAKEFVERMASDYNYNQTVKTGIPTGTQWDSMLRWMELQDYTTYKSYDGTLWGNYIDSEGNAAQGNYVSGQLRGTGTNQGWKSRNIYDVAGNLREWTSELTTEENVILRSNSFGGTGRAGSPSYGIPIADYLVPDAGFRMVLYID